MTVPLDFGHRGSYELFKVNDKEVAGTKLHVMPALTTENKSSERF